MFVIRKGISWGLFVSGLIYTEDKLDVEWKKRKNIVIDMYFKQL